MNKINEERLRQEIEQIRKEGGYEWTPLSETEEDKDVTPE